MSHYYDQEFEKMLEDIRLRNKIQDGSVATATKHEDFIKEPEDLPHVPEELVTKLFEEELDYPLMDGLPPPHPDLVEAVDRFNSQDRKETVGKPHGARYFYLGENAIITNKNEYHNLERLVADLVDCVESEAFTSARHVCEMALKAVRDLDDNMLNNMVRVRAQAVKSGKYQLHSYREKIDLSLLLDALCRHLLKILYISDIDEESGVHHLGHIAANCIMIETQLRLYHEA